MTERLVSVAVPLAVDHGFTYRVPVTWASSPAPGSRVLVPFGPRWLLGVVRADAVPQAPDAKIRELLEDLDAGTPTLPPDLVALCEWTSEYYLAPVGEVYRLALPGLLGTADARTVRITEAGRSALATDGPLLGGARLDSRERRLLETVIRGPPKGILAAQLARSKPRFEKVFGLLEELAQRGLCILDADDDGTQGRTELHVRRTDYLRDGNEGALRKHLGRSKQRRALLDYLDGRRDDDEGWVALDELRSAFTRARVLVDELARVDLVATEERPKRLDPFASQPVARAGLQVATAEQAAALAGLAQALDAGRFASALLHGITGSGKTEVYLQLIARARARGEGAVVLVPEIALTPQLADRFRERFGEEVAVLHSGLTPRQRLDAWQQIRAGVRPIVIGARSAIFAPVPHLRVVVVDEEHDASFKQEDGVRYHARDLALVRGRNLGCLVVLGSATPSLESYARALQGRHLYLRLTTRPTPRPLPTVEIVPLSVHAPDPESCLTAVMREAIRTTAAAGEQAIVFLNRRGYTTTMSCEACGSLQQCPDCSAPSMTYHLDRNRLMCHLCGHIEGTPSVCHACGAGALVHGGVGTERVEVALARELAGLRVLRLDRDSTRGHKLLRTLARFRAREADVLVGTQMLSKGHDFPGVTLVGILQGDHGLALPDPRAAERTFQLLTQVAGRAGRGDRPGRVLVQAWATEHPAITFAAAHDYEGFATAELASRTLLHNPPAGYLALCRVSGLDESHVQERSRAVAEFLRDGLRRLQATDPTAEVELLGPVASPIQKINRRTRWQLLVRSPTRRPLRWLLQGLRPRLGFEGSGPRQTLAIADVDPQNLL